MNKNLPVLEEEMKLFREAMQQVRPLQQDKYHLKSKTKNTKSLPPKHLYNLPQQVQLSDTTELMRSIQGDESISFARPGLQHKLLKKFKKGLISMEAWIDLHRCTTAEAIHRTEQFIQQAQQANKRYLGVIHGKGHFSKSGKAVLKTYLNEWLRGHSQVLAFHSAQPKDGGTGAIYVLIKKN